MIQKANDTAPAIDYPVERTEITMDIQKYLSDYSKIIGVPATEPYFGSDRQGNAIKKFSLLQDVEVEYSNNTILLKDK